MNDQVNESKQISDGLKKIIDTHGYSFQYAILKHLNELEDKREITWKFNCAEFPVIAGEVPVHIDFILRKMDSNTDRVFYLIAECKRVYQKRGIWCFARAPYTCRNQYGPVVIFDQFKSQDNCFINSQPLIHQSSAFRVYHIGFELIRTVKYDDEDLPQDGKKPINKSVTQVLRGSSGLINHFCKNIVHHCIPSFDGIEKKIIFIPVIFTTAKIWVTEVNISDADLKTGNLLCKDFTASNVPWIWYNYNRSHDLRHNFVMVGDRNEPYKDLINEFTRTIAIVNTEGIEDFLKFDLTEIY